MANTRRLCATLYEDTDCAFPEPSIQDAPHSEFDPLVESALSTDGKKCGVSFQLLTKVLREIKNTEKDPTGSRGAYYRKHVTKIVELFEEEHGNITQHYVCEGADHAAVRTAKPKFYAEYPLGQDPALESLFIQIDRLAIEASRLLRGRALEQCTSMIYSTAEKVLRLIDSRPARKCSQETADSSSACKNFQETMDSAHKYSQETVGIVKEQLKSVQEYHKRAARLRAQLIYSGGTLAGLVLIWFAAFIGWRAVTRVREIMFLEPKILVYVLLLGSLGAFISVLSRMSSKERLKLDYEADPAILVIVGICRPIIGAVFGAVLYALLESPLAPSIATILSELDATNLFYVVVGFLAGFSERLAPDMLQLAEGSVSGENQNASAESDKPTKST